MNHLLNLTASKPCYNQNYAQLVPSRSALSRHSAAPRGGQRKAHFARSRKASPEAPAAGFLCAERIRQARAVLRHSRLIAERVMAGQIFLEEARKESERC